jgi:hypothetical protein
MNNGSAEGPRPRCAHRSRGKANQCLHALLIAIGIRPSFAGSAG